MAEKRFLLKNTGYLDPQKVAKATALGYDSNKDEAPRVLASGKGAIAEQIIALAKANDIPIRADPLLAEALSTVNIGDPIPPELYALVAEVFAYIYRIKQRLE
ncbi:MAG: EscU/YscU/HrcU family type III secretion system export apparatus switch protein [Anaerolineales bacterium]